MNWTKEQDDFLLSKPAKTYMLDHCTEFNNKFGTTLSTTTLTNRYHNLRYYEESSSRKGGIKVTKKKCLKCGSLFETDQPRQQHLCGNCNSWIKGRCIADD